MPLLRRLTGPLLVVVFGVTWGACAVQPRYAEYALPEPADPQSVDCYNECDLLMEKVGREGCFARCAGVVETATDRPCERGGPPRLCTFDRMPAVASSDDEGVDTGGELVGNILSLVIGAAVSGSHEHEHASIHAAHPSHTRAAPRRASTPARHRAEPHRGN